jgi:AraC-like DNA-binding protein
VRKKAKVGERSQFPNATGGISRLAFALAKSHGVATDPILKAANISRHQIDNSNAPIAVADQIKFLNLIAEAVNDDLLGLHLALTAELRAIGLLYYVLASSDLIIQAMQQAVRYGSIVNEGVVQHVIDSDAIGISFRYVGVSRHTDRHQIEFWMTALVRIFRQLTGLRVLPLKLRLMHRRTLTSEFSEMFGDDIEFGADTDEILFARTLRETPIVSADPYLNKLLVSYCEQAVSHRKRSRGSFQARVENALAPLLPHGKATVTEAARRLGVSPRTFARRLAEEGQTFSSVLENLRSDLANQYLEDGDLPVSQIAWLLGYSEAASFSNAFRRWTGKSPRHARKHKREHARAQPPARPRRALRVR